MSNAVELIERWERADAALTRSNLRADCNSDLVGRLVDIVVAADAALCDLIARVGGPISHAGKVYSLDHAGNLEVDSQFPEAVPAAEVVLPEDDGPVTLRSTRWNYGRSGAATATATAGGSTTPPGGTSGPPGAA